MKLIDRKLDLIVVYKLKSNDELVNLLKKVENSFSWTVRSGAQPDEILIFLQANASTRKTVEVECNNMYDYFNSYYATSSVRKVVIPHDHKYNKELLHSLTSKYLISNEQLTGIKNAYGTNVGFYFAFLRTYFRSLVLPSLVGIICWYSKTEFSALYAIFISLYAIGFVEYWRVAERIISVEWGSDGSRSVELTRQETKQTAWYVREAKLLASLPILLLFAALLAALLTSIFMLEAFGLHFYEGPLKSYISLVPTVLFCVVVPQVIAVYQPVLTWLSKWENHPTHSDTDSSLTIKTFTINSLVSFGGLALTAYVYVPFGNTLMSIAGEKLGRDISNVVALDGKRIQAQLFAYMVTSQAVGSFQEVGMPFIMSFVKSHTSKNTYVPVDAPEEKEYLEEVRAEVSKEPYELFEDYAEMVTQFGYIALWSVAWPLGPLMGLINNFFEIRGDAFKLIKHHSKCIPRSTESIGPWLDTLSFLSWLGAMINTSLVILFNSSFKDIDLLNGHSGVLVAFIAALVASHGYFLVRGLFARLFKIAVWDNSTSAAIVRDRAMALHGSVHTVRDDNDPLDSNFGKLNETISELSAAQSRKDQ
ncbi:DUF590-domain-containing protein [Wallemia mellicola]|nr:DUF590-domain-containing protein [Wallemia mellicola]